MFYIFIFDFSLAALLLCAVALFVWCWSWIPFGTQPKAQSIYWQSAQVLSKPRVKELERRSA